MQKFKINITVIGAIVLCLYFGNNVIAQVKKIGTQTWDTKNLNVSTFRNGDSIPEVKSDEEWKNAVKSNQPAWCYYDNDPVNGKKFGKLYNWYAVNDTRGLAPKGWHIPSDPEWTVLTEFLGGEYKAQGPMKNTSGWDNVEVSGRVTSVGTNGTNTSGFAGLPGHARYYFGTFDKNNEGSWWSSSTSTLSEKHAFYRSLSRVGGSSIWPRSDYKAAGFSVRCLMD